MSERDNTNVPAATRRPFGSNARQQSRRPAAAAWLFGLVGITLLAASPVSANPAWRDLITNDAPWLSEEDFALNPALHATRDQTVVLHLESRQDLWDRNHQRRRRGNGHRWRAIVRNISRFIVEDERDFSFCIPADEPHIVRLKLRKRRGWIKKRGRTVLDTRPGDPCEQITLTPGAYALHLYHDSRTVSAGGKKAFLHDPEQPRLLGGDASSGQPDFMSFKATNGLYVSSDIPDEPFIVEASSEEVRDKEIWTLDLIDGNEYSLTDGDGERLSLDGPVTAINPAQGPAWLYFKVFGNQPISPRFIFHDLGGWEFTLSVKWEYDKPGKAGIEVLGINPVNRDLNTNRLLLGDPNPSNPEHFQAVLKGFDCSSGCDSDNLPLTRGEVALFSECDYMGTGVVSVTDVDRFAAFDVTGNGGDIPPQEVRSARVGPVTYAILYAEPDFGGDFQGISTDLACLDTTANVSSFRIVLNATSFIITTDGCVNCTLTDIDLSRLDLSNGDFANSSFLNANLSGTKFTNATMTGVDLSRATLTGTVFDGAHLAGANLSEATMGSASFRGANLTHTSFLTAADLAGADFSNGTVLHCTSFEGSDLTGAVFDNPADTDIIRDFSCRMSLAHATVDSATFAVGDWRYLDLTGSTVNGVPAVLSTASSPLDLSGASLSNVTWLAGKTLDGVNLGCFSSVPNQADPCPPPGTTPVCTMLQGTDLSQASLKRACLKNASLQGASLSFSNLDGADLSDAKLLGLSRGSPATLTGSFMRDASLARADLSGVIANDVNFYSSSSGTADATGATMTGAKFNNAYLANADFSGAVLESTEWTHAVLVGANFNKADLSKNATADEVTDFTSAYLQGAVFANSMVTGANFTNSYWDPSGSGALNILVQRDNLEFTGYWNDPSAPECVQTTYPTPTFPSAGTPQTTASNTCPNGDLGPCDAVWDIPKTPIDQAVPQSAIDPDLPGDCTETDILWLFDVGSPPPP